MRAATMARYRCTWRYNLQAVTARDSVSRDFWSGTEVRIEGLLSFAQINPSSSNTSRRMLEAWKLHTMKKREVCMIRSFIKLVLVVVVLVAVGAFLAGRWSTHA